MKVGIKSILALYKFITHSQSLNTLQSSQQQPLAFVMCIKWNCACPIADVDGHQKQDYHLELLNAAIKISFNMIQNKKVISLQQCLKFQITTFIILTK